WELSAAAGTLTTVGGWTPARGVTPICGYIGADGEGMLFDPAGLALTSQGTLLVADSLNNRVRQLTF
ncbi:MAG TPA: hypothetical protein VE991_14850, partial [Acidimicrobiales bacterium]|nr:hypothetical protein [Acidimicrobiales bacterium]